MVQASIQNRYLLELADIRLSSDMRCGFCHLNDLQHLHSRDLAISVQVVHVECPVELLLKAPPGGDGQRTDELPEVNGAISVLIKGPEGVLSKLGSVTIWEELKREE